MKKYNISFIIILLIFITNSIYAEWVKCNETESFYVLSLLTNQNTLYCGTLNGIYISTNTGLSWIHSGLYNGYIRSIKFNNSYVFAATYVTGVFRSSDNGMNWSLTGLEQSPNALTVSGDDIYAGTDLTIWKSTDNGDNWVQTAINNKRVNSLAVNRPYVFASFEDTPGVYLTSNGGVNWIQALNNNYEYITLHTDSNNIYAGSYMHGIYYSSNNGSNWVDIGLPGLHIVTIITGGNYIFAASGYMFKSSDCGVHWETCNEGFPISEFSVHAFCISDNFLIAGTSQGIWRRPLSELIGIKIISSEVPVKFELYQNYPNPFNPTTKIKFDIPSEVRSRNFEVRLVIYDLLGKEVTSLVNGELKPGTYEVEWNASDFPNGVYFYRLTGEGFSESKKLIFIK